MAEVRALALPFTIFLAAADRRTVIGVLEQTSPPLPVGPCGLRVVPFLLNARCLRIQLVTHDNGSGPDNRRTELSGPVHCRPRR